MENNWKRKLNSVPHYDCIQPLTGSAAIYVDNSCDKLCQH